MPGLDPILDYVSRGWRQGISANEYFDVNWYLARNPDVRAAGVEPMLHFLRHGRIEGRRAHPHYENDFFFGTVTTEKPAASTIFAAQRTPSPDYWLSPTPLVSIIVANMDGQAHLPFLFDSLDQQTYRNFEVIFVDDASTDGSVAFARQRGAKIVALTRRTGFAQANNEGLAHAGGELIALLNNDMRVDANWLESMVATLREDHRIGAVAPLIRFWCKFQRFEMTARAPFSLNLSTLRESLGYKKYFVRAGVESARVIASQEGDGNFLIVIDLPIQTKPHRIFCQSDAKQVLTLTCGATQKRWQIGSETTIFDFYPSKEALRGGFFIVNNAGSCEISTGQPADRAFGEVDSNQFTAVEPVPFLCGGAALIRRDALLGRPIFIGAFTAYYEDSELSVRLQRDGYRILFDPRAIVYHRHSATNVEKSGFWRRFTYRNKYLYTYRYADRAERLEIKHNVRLELRHLAYWYGSQTNLTSGEQSFFDAIPSIESDLTDLFGRMDATELPEKTGRRIGVFNPFWKTFGGGEAHALHIIEALTRFGQVEMISDSDFDLELLLQFFGGPSINVRKRIVRRMTPEISADYDIFVNSAFQNEMPSLAPQSYFIISFPSRTPSPAFLQSYHFLANSNFTLGWAKKFWGQGAFKGDVVYPAVDAHMMRKPREALTKSRTILNVGRFAARGHTKNQKEIAEAFLAAADRDPALMSDWELVLIGSANDEAYVAEVAEIARRGNIRMILDAPYQEVVAQYARSAIYVHASGLGRDENAEPELMEHFGMAVAQAAGSGCYPIVYGAAGPREIVDLIEDGLTFRTVDELALALRQTIAKANSGVLEKACAQIVERAQLFSREKQHERLLALFETCK